MQLHKAFKTFRRTEEFSGAVSSVSVYQDGRVFIGAECPYGAIKWTVSLSPSEALKIFAEALRNVAPDTPAMPVLVEHAVQDADNPHFVENHR